MTKSIIATLAFVAMAMVGAFLAGCQTAPGAPPPDPVAEIKAGVAAAQLTVTLLESNGVIKKADVDKFNAQAAMVLQILAAVGPVASLADPKLKPALDALAALQSAVAVAQAAAPPH